MQAYINQGNSFGNVNVTGASNDKSLQEESNRLQTWMNQGNTFGKVNVTGAQTITDKLNSDISSSTGGTQQQGIDLQVTVNGKPI